MYKTHRAIYRKGKLNNSRDATSAETNHETSGNVWYSVPLAGPLALVTTLHSSLSPSAVNLRERIVLEVQLRPRL